MQAAIKKHDIRILLGVFTCPAEQVVDIARSGGAAGTRPFCQTFYRYTRDCELMDPHIAGFFGVNPWDGENYLAHPAYAVIFRP